MMALFMVTGGQNRGIEWKWINYGRKFEDSAAATRFYVKYA